MDPWRLLGYAKTSFHTHPSSISLPPKHSEKETTTLLEFCKSSTPPCNLHPLLFNGHLQTFWTALKGYDIPIYYRRRVFDAEDPAFDGSFAVDFVVEPFEDKEGMEQDGEEELPPRTAYYDDDEFEGLGSEDTKPMVVTLHGLSGGSHEIYLRHVLRPLVEKGWEACVVNSRGCAKSKITTGVLYNARATWDVRQTVRWLRKKFPNRPLFGLGFSLGANILVNYLGEEGEGCEFKAAVVCSNPWNLDVSSRMLGRTWVGREVYLRTMGSSMKELFERYGFVVVFHCDVADGTSHVEQISKNPRVDVEKVRNITYLHEFDRELQGPTWGYPTEGAYYRDASSCDSLLAVRIPLLAINAEDDPIAVKEAIPFQEFRQNPYTVLCTTSLGGHLSWFETGGGRWFARAASHFMMQLYDEVDLNELGKAPGKMDHTGAVDAPLVEYASFKPMRRKLHIPTEAYH